MSKARDIGDSAATINYIDTLSSNAQTQLDGKADLSGSPTFTGTVTANAASITGTVTANAFSGDGSALTNLPATGGAADFVAQGAISNGATVALRSDGKVEAVTGILQAGSIGSEADAGGTYSVQNACAYDSSTNKMVIVYKQDSDNTYYSVVGSVSGQSITFGTPASLSITNTQDNERIDVVFNAQENRFVAFLYDTSTFQVIAGEVSGTSITWGSAVAMPTNTTRLAAVNIDGTSNILTAHVTGADNKATVISVSGSTITINTAATIKSGSTNNWNLGLCYNADDDEYGHTFISQNDQYYSFITVSGTTPTATTPVLGQGTSPRDSDIVWHRELQQYVSFVIMNSTAFPSTNYGFEARQFTQSGGTITTISTHNILASTSSGSRIARAIYEPNSKFVFLSYHAMIDLNGSSFQKAALLQLKINASSIENGELVALNSANVLAYGGFAYDSTNKQILVSSSKYIDDYVFAQARRYFAEDTNANNFIGFAESAISSGATGTITILSGTNTSQSSLSVGSKYWVNADGTLSSSQTSYPEAGFATASNTIVMANTNDTVQSGSRWMFSSSALSAGDLVFSDGNTVGALTITPDLNPTKSINNTLINWSNLGSPQQVVAHPGGYVIIFRNTSTNYLNAIAVSDSGGVLTAGTQTALFSAGLNAGQTNMKCVYHELDNRFWVVYGGTSNQTYVGSFTVSGTSISYINQSTPYYYGQYYYDMDIDQATGRILINTLYTGSTSKYVIGFKPSGSSTGSFYATNYGGSSASNGVSCLYVPEHDKWVITEQYNPYTDFRHVTFDGTSAPTVSSSTSINLPGSFWSTGEAYAFSRSWSAYYDRLMYFKPDGNLSPAQTRMDVFTFDGTNFAHESQINMYAVNSDNAYSTYYSYDYKKIFNPFNTEYIYVGTSGGYNGYTYDSSAGTLTRVFGPKSIYSSGYTTNFDIYGVKFHYQSTASTSGYGGQFPVASTDSANFLGFAQNACSANATVQVNVAGAIDTNQSSLTANTKYYVDDLGNLTTSDTGTFAGTAISPNNVYVKV
jgi:hypothetical protein